jgi:rifampicin phosphotransferase
LLEEAEHLVQAHVVREKEVIFYLTFQELNDVVRTNQVDDQLIRQHKDAFRRARIRTTEIESTIGTGVDLELGDRGGGLPAGGELLALAGGRRVIGRARRSPPRRGPDRHSAQ